MGSEDDELITASETAILEDIGNFLLVAPLTHPSPPPPLELLESPTVRRLSNNFRGGGGTTLVTWVPQNRQGKPGAQKSKIVFKPNPYCLPKCMILYNISDATKRGEVQFKLFIFLREGAERH